MTSSIRNQIRNDIRKGDKPEDVSLRYGVTYNYINKIIPIKIPTVTKITVKSKSKPKEEIYSSGLKVEKFKDPVMVAAGKKAWKTRRKLYGKTGRYEA